ncbi:MAG: hypothetical protein AB1641_03430 [Thermodesulfobacteriota bacterium]
MKINCVEHRDSQTLIALRRRLSEDDLEADERQSLEAEADRIETELGLR